MGNRLLKVINYSVGSSWLTVSESWWNAAKSCCWLGTTVLDLFWSILIGFISTDWENWWGGKKIKLQFIVSGKMQCTESWLTSLLHGPSRWICNNKGAMVFEIGAASWNRKHISVNTSGCIWFFFLRIKTDVFSLTIPHVWSPLHHFSILPVAIVSK